MFLCDEYQAFATTRENEPSGEEKFFSLLASAKQFYRRDVGAITVPIESTRTPLHGLRAKIFVTFSGDFSARVAAHLVVAPTA